MRGTIPEDQGALLGVGIAAPGAGNVIYIHADLGRRWLISGVKFLFTTDATAINRQVYWEYWDTFLSGAMMWHITAQAASLARTYHLHSGYSGGPFTTLSHYIMPLAPMLLANERVGIRISADNLQGGDAFTAIVVYGQQWLED